VGSRRDCAWILGLPGFRVETIEGQDEAATACCDVRKKLPSFLMRVPLHQAIWLRIPSKRLERLS
jgi:hypothetical protein